MVDMAAIAGAAGALKTALDLAKSALGMHDAALIRAKVTEMQGEISTALAGAITAQTDQLAMLNRVDKLEKELAKHEAWDAEKKRYQMERLPPGVLVYTLKQEAAAPAEEIHSICPTCYHRSKTSPLQATEPSNGVHHLKCFECGTGLEVGIYRPSTVNRHRSDYDPLDRYR